MILQMNKKSMWQNVVIFSEKQEKTIRHIIDLLFLDPAFRPMRILDNEGNAVAVYSHGIKQFDVGDRE